MGKAEKTRQFILEKTAPLFNKKGYAGTSMSDITEATGLTKGSIYGNFVNKEEMAVIAFEYNTGRLMEAMYTAISAKKSATEKLLAMTQFYLENWQTVFDKGGCPMLNTAIEADDAQPFLQASVRASFANWERKIVGIIELGIQQMEFKSNLVATDYASTIIVLIEGGIMLSKITNNPHPLYLSISRIITIIENELI